MAKVVIGKFRDDTLGCNKARGVILWMLVRLADSRREQPGAGLMWSRNANDTSNGHSITRVEREGMFT